MLFQENKGQRSQNKLKLNKTNVEPGMKVTEWGWAFWQSTGEVHKIDSELNQRV